MEALAALVKALRSNSGSLSPATVLRQMSLVFYFLTDQLVFLNASGFFQAINVQFWKRFSCGGWMMRCAALGSQLCPDSSPC